MRRLVSVVAAVLLSTVGAVAQEAVVLRVGCLSYDEALAAMPEYAQVDREMDALREQYEAELTAAEEEFNVKYETFLSEYANYAPSILRKRQAELEDLLRRNERFRAEALRLLEQARAELLVPVRQKLTAVIEEVAAEYSLAFVLNSDADAVPFINKSMVYNITRAVRERLAGDE